jgi:hypothetical protein
VVTTPGTARFDVRMGPSGTIIVFDTGALNLNVVAKTTVPWLLEIWLTCRAVGTGTATNFLGIANFQSEAVVGSPVNTAGGNGSLLAPVGAHLQLEVDLTIQRRTRSMFSLRRQLQQDH